MSSLIKVPGPDLNVLCKQCIECIDKQREERKKGLDDISARMKWWQWGGPSVWDYSTASMLYWETYIAAKELLTASKTQYEIYVDVEVYHSMDRIVNS
jgi:hypothetical protein